MAVIRINKTQNYTVMSNRHFQEREMTLKAKGLLSLMLSLPDNWDYNIEGLATLSKDGKDGVRAALKELERFGYMKRKRARNEKGVLEGAVYTIYEEPQTPVTEKPTLEKPTLEKPTLEKPTLENPTQLNTNILNTNISNTNISNTNQLNTKCVANKEKHAQITRLYNKICISLIPFKKMTAKRKEAIDKILSIYSIDQLEEIFKKAEASEYCKGSREGWKAGFDWLMNEDNIAKLLEGNYDTMRNPKSQRKEVVPSWMIKETSPTYDNMADFEERLLANGTGSDLTERVEKLKERLKA